MEWFYFFVVVPLLLVFFWLPFWFPLAFWFVYWAERRKVSWGGIALFAVVESIGAAFFVFVLLHSAD